MGPLQLGGSALWPPWAAFFTAQADLRYNACEHKDSRQISDGHIDQSREFVPFA
jgi:hypothetical protein